MTAPYIFAVPSVPSVPLSSFEWLLILLMDTQCRGSKLTMIPSAKSGAGCTAELPSLRLCDAVVDDLQGLIYAHTAALPPPV